MNENHRALHEALERWEVTACDEQEPPDLERFLNSPEAQRTLVERWLIESALPHAFSQRLLSRDLRRAPGADCAASGLSQRWTPAVGHEDQPLRFTVKRKSNAWRTVSAAAVGVLSGVVGAAFLFGTVGFAQRKLVRILDESFESGQAPITEGVPRSPGFWGGDFSAVVGAQSGVEPRTGSRMFQFDRADYEGKHPGFSWSGDIHRVIDLREQEFDGADGRTTAVAEAFVRSVPFESPQQYGASICIRSFDHLPESFDSVWHATSKSDSNSTGETEAPSAMANRFVKFDPTGKHWKKLRVEMRIQPGTRYLLLSLSVSDHIAGRNKMRSGSVRFPGHFLDDVHMTLVRDPSAL